MLTNVIERFLRLIYPNRCLLCNKIISGKYFCSDCAGQVAPIKIKTCPDCGLVMSDCACKFYFYYFDEIVSCFEGSDNAKKAFYSFKFYGNYLGYKYFADEMVNRIKSKMTVIDFDFITAVPSHRSNKSTRDYDPVYAMARYISKRVKLPFKRVLYQPNMVLKQHEAETFEQRYQNVKNKYKIKKSAKIKGKSVLLIDDIKTTGATLSECARELKLAGAKTVIVASALTIPSKKRKEKINN